MSRQKVYKLCELAELLQFELIGDGECTIDSLATLKSAQSGSLAFLSNPAYVSQLSDCKASAVILHPDLVSSFAGNKLVSDNPYLGYARASVLFASAPAAATGIHPRAYVADSAILGSDVTISANAVIGENVRLGDGCFIGPGSVIGDNCKLGENCRLHANVTLYHEVQLGTEVIVHSSAVLGADGFGFASDGGQSIKIMQLGGVVIGDNVEIGAASTIDRGAIENTIIEQGVKIDNHVQIGHNCQVGQHTIICGCAAIAGSTKVGQYCMIGGGVGIVGHISIADKVHLTARTLITRSIDKPGVYSSGTGFMENKSWRRNAVRFSQLDDLAKRLKELERSTDTPTSE